MKKKLISNLLLLWGILLSPGNFALGAESVNCRTSLATYGRLITDGPVAPDEHHFIANQDQLSKKTFDFAKYFRLRQQLTPPAFADLASEGPEAIFAFLDAINLHDLKNGNYQTAYWEMLAHPRRMKKIAQKIPSVFRTQTELANFALWYYERFNGPVWRWRDFLRYGAQIQGQQSLMHLMQIDHFHRSLRQHLAITSLPIKSWKDLMKYPGSKILFTLLINSHLFTDPAGALLIMYLPHRQINLLHFDFTGLPSWSTIKKEGLFTLGEMEAYLYRTGKVEQATQLRLLWSKLRGLQLQNGAISALLLGSYGLFLYQTVQETFTSLEALTAGEGGTNSSEQAKKVVNGPTREEAIFYLQEVMARHYQGGDPEELKKLQQNVPLLVK